MTNNLLRWQLLLLVLLGISWSLGVHAQVCWSVTTGGTSGGNGTSWTGNEATYAAAFPKILANDTQCFSDGNGGCLGKSYDGCTFTGAPADTNPVTQNASCTVRLTGGGWYGMSANADHFSCAYWLDLGPLPMANTHSEDAAGDPINPGPGNVYKREQDDVAVVGSSPIRFQRFYDSADGHGSDLGTAWRHTYTRSIGKSYDLVTVAGYSVQNATATAQYGTPGAACSTGFAAVQSSISAWNGATATYTYSGCVISNAQGTLATLKVYAGLPLPNDPTKNPPVEYDVVRDDGQTFRYTQTISGVTAPPGVSLRLAVTSSGYTLTDDQDTVETYDSSGALQSIASRSGVVQSLTYDASLQLTSVTDSFGNVLNISRNAAHNILSVSINGGVATQYAYDAASRLSTVTYADSTTHTFNYENTSFTNALTSELDENAATYVTWTYDSKGRGITSSLAAGAAATSVSYNDVNSITTSATVTDALGAARTYAFTRIGDVIPVTGISGSPCWSCADGAGVTYDGGGWVSSRTDYNGNVTCFANDAARGLELVRVEGFASGTSCPSSLSSYTPAAGTRQRKISTTWNSTFREPATVTEANRTTSFTYDSTGNALTKTVTDTTVSPNVARTWTYTYDSFGHMLTMDGPRTDVSDVTTYAYYSCVTGSQCGQLHTVTNAAGQVTTFNTYNGYGQPLTITDPNGTLTTLTYDARQRLASRQMGSELTGFTYWPTGLLKKVTLPDSSYLLYTYDNAHRLTQISDGGGNSITYILDALGNRTSEQSYDASNALHRSHSRVINTLNEISKEINAAGTAAVTTTFGYDANGNQNSVAAPLSRNTSMSHDELNRPNQITDPATGITQFTYDTDDNVASVTDPRGLATSYGYNGFGEPKSQTSPDTGSTANTYDSAGNLSTSTDARGAVSTYGYDLLNRVASVAYSQGGSTDQTIAFTYDTGANGKGHLSGASDANHSLSWGYDAQGRVLSKAQTAGGHTLSVGYAYTNGNLITLTTPAGRSIVYGYNSNHQVTSVSVNGTTILNTVTYEPFGAANGWTWGNGTITSRTYDADGDVSQISSAAAKAYTYDNASRITGITDSSSAVLSWTYGYDALDRVTSDANSTQSDSYTYDADGNRLTQGGAGGSSTYSTPAGSNRLTSITGTNAQTYTYDSAGNALTRGAVTFTYNAAGRMKTSSGSSGSTSYTYNALGQRIAKTNSGVSTYFAYDEAGHLLGEYDGSGVPVEEIVWLGDIPIATVRLEPCGLSIFYIHTDHLNAPRRITRRSTADIVWSWDGDPFGNTAPNENPSGFGVFSFNLRFPGQYYDAETGLSQNYFRDYDAAAGRYVESDPIGLHGGSHSVYTYVGSDPVGSEDWLGLCKIELRFKPVPIFGRFGLYHGYVVTTDTDGSQKFFRGGPGSPSSQGIFGDITTSSGPYVSGTPDWSGSARPSMVVYQDGQSCSCENKSFSSFLQRISQAEIPYRPNYQNSNSVVGEMLRDSGFQVGALPVTAPGFNQDLSPYINSPPESRH